MTDGEVLPKFLKRTQQRAKEILGNGADETRQCYKTVRVKRVISIIPPRKGATFR
ncbi:Transposase [Candidatus Enterovibrio altilux]|uniref:Transposase n=1 Tax=Candidatus Enterovibrio altilux TaxID=1927128 RepID=A0A291BB77_9GAMM|nr:Transposase [Candidatus Enterovibrio luxaltus]